MTGQERIDRDLREDGHHYTFADLRDRFERGLAEAVEYGDDTVTVKIPSSTEFSAAIGDVREALAETRRTSRRMF